MGKMASAIARGITTLGQDKICFFDVNSSIQIPGMAFLPMHDLIVQSNILFICVKPQQAGEILAALKAEDLGGKSIITILAGIPIKTFEHALGISIPIIRVMPNMPVVVGEGMSCLCFNQAVNSHQKELANRFFSALGRVEIVEEATPSSRFV